MRFFRKILYFCCFLLSGIYVLQRVNFYQLQVYEKSKGVAVNPTLSIPLVLVLCKDPEIEEEGTPNVRRKWTRQKEQILALFGSLVYMSSLPLIKVILFVDELETYSEVIAMIQKWPESTMNRIQIEMKYLDKNMLASKSMNVWRQCASAKLFFDELLPEYDSMISLDTDIVFMGAVEDMYKAFRKLEYPKAIGASPELWYSKEAQEGHHRIIAGQYGINTGVLFLNLTSLRSTVPEGLGFALQQIKEFGRPPRHDQDILNAYLKDKPELLLELPTSYNFIPSSCMDIGPYCEECNQNGILVLHGADSSFYRLIDIKSRVSFTPSVKTIDILIEIFKKYVSCLYNHISGNLLKRK